MPNLNLPELTLEIDIDEIKEFVSKQSIFSAELAESKWKMTKEMLYFKIKIYNMAYLTEISVLQSNYETAYPTFNYKTGETYLTRHTNFAAYHSAQLAADSSFNEAQNELNIIRKEISDALQEAKVQYDAISNIYDQCASQLSKLERQFENEFELLQNFD
uniref:Uncharacterized protein n=1 Tax=Panagrolaimus sp. ES5 TaxID=591445 RepID=A0AC34G3G3_9BILA